LEKCTNAVREKWAKELQCTSTVQKMGAVMIWKVALQF
jgi:hypothetical protein